MHKCQCKRDCEAQVKTPEKKFARGHDPASHADMEKKAKAISKGRKRFFRNGGISWWKGKKHSKETIAKLSERALNRTPKHIEHFHLAMKERSNNPVWKAAHELASIKGNAAWEGKHHTKETKLRIAASVGRAVSDRPEGPVHGTQGRIRCEKLGGVITYRSPLERRFIEWLDNCESIQRAAYEPIGIPYHFGGKAHYYHPDFALFFKTVRWMLVEVKPRYVLDRLDKKAYRKEKAKLVAVYAFCQKHDLRFMLVDEHWLEKRAA